MLPGDPGTFDGEGSPVRRNMAWQRLREGLLCLAGPVPLPRRASLSGDAPLSPVPGLTVNLHERSIAYRGLLTTGPATRSDRRRPLPLLGQVSPGPLIEIYGLI